MTRLQVFVWTMFACLSSALSICLVAAAVVMSSSFAPLLMNAWFLAFFVGFLVLYLGGGIGILLGLAAMLERKVARDAWGKRARAIALWASPIGILAGIVRFILQIPAKQAV